MLPDLEHVPSKLFISLIIIKNGFAVTAKRDPDIYTISDGRCCSQSPMDKETSGQAGTFSETKKLYS